MQPNYSTPKPKSKAGLIIGLVVAGVVVCCVLPSGGLFFGGKALIDQGKGFVECSIAFKDVGKAIAKYAEMNGGKLPNAKTWQSDVAPFYADISSTHKDVGPLRIMPATGEWGCVASDKGESGISFNAALSGKKLADIKDKSTILIYEVPSRSKNQAANYKPLDPATGPMMMMGQRRGWATLSVDQRLIMKGPKGQDLKIDTEGGTKGLKVETP